MARTPGSGFVTEAMLEEALSGIDTSGSGILIVRTSSLAAIPAGSTEGELVGYRNSAPSSITVAGETLASGDWAVWCWLGSAWVLLNKSGSSGGVIVPDTTPPTGATLAVSGTGEEGSTRTLTVSGAVDTGAGLHAQPYRFSIDGGTNWTTWQAAAAWTSPALDDGTYQPRAEVRDAADPPNVAAVSAPDFVVTPVTTFPNDIYDDFDRFAEANTPIVGTTMPTGHVWESTTEISAVLQQSGTHAGLYSSGDGRAKFVPGNMGLTLATNHVHVSMDVDITAATTMFVGIGSSSSDRALCYLTRTASGEWEVKISAGASGDSGSYITPITGPVRYGVSYDGTTCRIYLDDTEVRSRPVTIVGTSLGIRPGSSGAGSIDDFGVDFL